MINGCLVIIPLFNESKTIEAVLRETRSYYRGDILIIDDGSTDNSISIIKSLSDSRIVILTHQENLGYGRSLIDGFQYAIKNRYSSVVTMDCDFQHEPCCIPQFLAELKNTDVISGSRYFFDFVGNDSAPADRSRINKIITTEINRITSYNLTDAFCGFKAYRVSALKNLRLTEGGYGMPLQFWLQAFALGLTIKEIPVKRIYPNLNRSFGEELDNPENRLSYYYQVINKEKNVIKCSTNRCASR